MPIPRRAPSDAAPPHRGRRSGTAPVAFLLVALLLGGALLLAPPLAPDAAASSSVHWFRGDGLHLDAIHIDVHATETLARTQLRFELDNPTNDTIEAIFDIPLPPHATLTGFTLRVDDATWAGMVQERATARAEYEEAKGEGEDAVLLEAADDTRIRLLLNVPAGADRTLNFTYLQPVALESGARTYRLALSALAALEERPETLTATVRIESGSGLGAVQTPGMHLQPTERTTHRYTASGSADPGATIEDLVVLWTEGHGTWRPTLVSSVTPGRADAQEASLVASLVPPETEGGLPRDIVFILDTSGSMDGDKIVQARESLREVLLTLRPNDRYGLVTFESTVTRVTPALRPVTDTGIQDTRRILAATEAVGGTNFAGGLQEGLDLLHDAADPERVPIVVLLSDGMPTAGITDHRMIIADMLEANTRGAAVHLLAIGLDADDTFLEDVAGQTGGTLTLLHPDDDLKARLNGFYASLEDPVLTNVRITIEGTDVRDRYPTVLPALYKGDTLRIAFRDDLRNGTPILMHLEATSADGPVVQTFAFDAENITVLPEAERLWGSMHVAALLSEERREGTNDALRAAILEAAIRHGIVTPYTSWVITAPVVEESPDPTTPPSGAPVAHKVLPGSLSQSGDGLAYNWADGSGGGLAGAPDDRGTTEPAEADDAATPGPALLVLLATIGALLAVLRRRD